MPGGDWQSPSVSGLKYEKDPCRIPAQVYCERTGLPGQHNMFLPLSLSPVKAVALCCSTPKQDMTPTFEDGDKQR